MQILPRFALEKIVDAPVHMLDAAGHAQDLLAAVAGFGPYRAALAGAMHDPVRHAAQRNHCSSMIIAIVVVLPAPLPPSRPVMLPRLIRNDTSSTARVVL